MHITPISIPCHGYSIAADWHETDNQNTVLLAIQGYASTKQQNAPFISEISEGSGISTLAIDLSGHGESPFNLNDTTPAQHLLEVATAFDWLVAQHPSADVYVMGTSYGGYMAAWLSHFRDFEKLVLRTPAIYKPEDFYTPHGQIEKAEQLALYRNNSVAVKNNPIFQQASIFTGESLVLVHGLDADVPLPTSNAYTEAFNAEEYIAEGFYHAYRSEQNPDEKREVYKTALIAWLLK